MQRGYDCRPDLCATGTDIAPNLQLGNFYTDSLVHDHRALKYLVDVIGKVIVRKSGIVMNYDMIFTVNFYSSCLGGLCGLGLEFQFCAGEPTRDSGHFYTTKRVPHHDIDGHY